MKALACGLCLILGAGVAFAVSPGQDLYLVSVGHAQGACVGSPPVCSQWRTSVWVYDPSTTDTAHVTVYFLERSKDNTSAASQSFTVAPGETKEFPDIIFDPLGISNKYGSLRFTSDIDVVVTGRIFDQNIHTATGAIGTSGQFFAGTPGDLAIGLNESTDVIGLAQDASGTTGTWRSNFGFTETTGASCTVQVQRLDGNGNVLATKNYSMQPYGSQQYPITDIGGALGTNQRLQVTVTAGSGKIIAFASRIDNRTGDPSTVEMSAQVGPSIPSTGLFDGIVLTPDGLQIDGGVELSIASTGLTGFAGVAGLQCGADSYVVDFSGTASTPIALNSDGSFSAQVTIAYSDGTNTVFSTDWTLEGTLQSDGSINGTDLKSVTSGGITSGGIDYSLCDGTIDRAWRAGRTGSL
jgi:hypothetical protein